ncbi:MAG: bacillithiol biosynthesis cysteine-adding enzyme BshC [Saprospiraceae bacterium]|nr:bacillithiol biosynthesis cysteine-adding enzyme BshC [Saprospiraceae bacterium]
MRKTLLPYPQIPQLAKTDLAYATGEASLGPFYQYEPEIQSFAAIIEAKGKASFPRQDLVVALREQYSFLPETAPVFKQIEALASPDTFTVVTAHQPALLLGPMYFIYKAVTTINLAEAVHASTGKRIVPVFVLGSEDHDLEELNHINLFGRRLEWQSGEQGAVGSMNTDSLTPVLDHLKGILGESEAAQTLFGRIEKAYASRATFSEATQALLHEFLGRFGLVVLNMNHPALKRHFIPVMRDELLHHTAHRLVSETVARLNELGFKTQAAPREINLFYLRPGSRERIVRDGGVYKVLNTNLVFSEKEILAELDEHPERFSPNVVLRPLFQEMVLPNLAYVGGGGELAYWLERKSLYEHFGVNFPMLLRRNSVQWFDRDAVKKLHKFGFSPAEFFHDTDALVRVYIDRHAAAEVSLESEIEDLKAIYERLAQKASAIDPTLDNAVRADGVKATGNFEQWQNRLLRAEKQKHEVALNQIRAGKEKLFPGGGLQERHDNFIPYQLKYGETFLDTLKTHLDPFDKGLVILEDAE